MPDFDQDPHKTSLAQAKDWLRKQINDGATCPCCTQFAKVYKRKLNGAMAYVLILINRYHGGDWIHVPSYINEQVKNANVSAAIRGDWAKLTHWGLIEDMLGERPDGSSRVGYYKITDAGRAFAQNRLRVPKHVWIYDGRALTDRKDTETVSVVEAMGQKFNYTELMRAR